MDLLSKIEEDLKNALKNKEEAIISTLRLLKSTIKNKEIEKRDKLTNQEILELISREIKKRKEALELYQKGGRLELAQKEEEEIKILKNYMPQEISEEELEKIIKEVIDKVNAKDSSDLGKVMSLVMPKVKGRVDGSIVSRKVAGLLKK